MNAFANVVRAELFKAVRKRRTYILAGLWWVLLPALVLIVGRVLQVNLRGSFVDQEGAVTSVVQALASPFGIARAALVGPAYMSPTFYIIVIALLAALFVGEERSHNMWKTTLVAQPNRLAVLAGKFASAMLILGVLLLGAFGAAILFGAIGTTFLATSWEGEWGQLLGLYGLQWLYSATAVVFAFLLVFMMRSLALGMVTIFFLPALLEGIYTAYATLVGFQPLNRLNALFQALRLRQTLEDLPRYFFTNNLYAPAREPLSGMLRELGNLAEGPNVQAGPDIGAVGSLLGAGITLPHAGLVMLGYGLALGALLVWLFLRRDVS